MPKRKYNTDILGKRAMAIVLDTAILLLVSIIMIYAFGSTKYLPASGSRKAGNYLVESLALRVAVLVVYLLYYILLEWQNGATYGKYLTNIRVRNEKGKKITLSQSLIRNLVRLIDYLPLFYVVGFFIARANDKHQRLGDKVAKTIVILEVPKKRSEYVAQTTA